MKKLLAVILVLVMLLTQFAIPSFAIGGYGDAVEDEWEDPYAGLKVKSIEVEATKNLIENADGFYDLSFDGEEIFVYEFYYAEPVFTVKFENGEEETGVMDDLYEGVMFNDDQYEKPWGIGKHQVTGTYRDADFSFEIEVVECPVASITAVAQTTLVEDWDTYEEYYYDENGDEHFFVGYNLYYAEPIFTVVMKDGSVITGTDEEIGAETGYYTYDATNQYEKPLKVGKNTVQFVFMGVECDCEIEVIPNPYESITVSGETELVLEFKGVKAEDSFTTKIVNWDGVAQDGGAWGYVTTDNGYEFWVDYYCYMDDDGITYLNKDVTLQVGPFTTNTLERNDWLLANFTASGTLYYSLGYYMASESLTGKAFEGYFADAEIKNIDDLVAISTYVCEMDPEENGEYFVHTLSVKDVEENIELVFGLTDVDVKASSFYNKASGKVVVKEPFYNDVYYEVNDFGFKNGEWVLLADVYNWETEEFILEAEVVLNKDFKVERIDATDKKVVAGDANCDGKVTASDARLVLQYVVCLADEYDVNMIYADVNGDDEITAVDARMILQKVAGLIE